MTPTASAARHRAWCPEVNAADLKVLRPIVGIYPRQSKQNGKRFWSNSVLLALTNTAGLPLASNLHCSLRRLDLMHAFAVTDYHSALWAHATRVPALRIIRSEAAANVYEREGGTLSNCKVRLAIRVVQAGLDVLFVDTDTAWRYDPLPFLARIRVPHVIIALGWATRQSSRIGQHLRQQPLWQQEAFNNSEMQSLCHAWMDAWREGKTKLHSNRTKAKIQIVLAQ